MADLTRELYAKIIVNVSVGEGFANQQVEYELKTGTIEKVSISECITRLLADTIKRTYSTHHLILPMFMHYSYTPSDWLFDRNVRRFRAFIQDIINLRKKVDNKSMEGDLLSILLESDFYTQKNGDDLIIDEVFTFFLAGMKTIQVTTTNLVYYLTKQQDIRNKLLAELLPAMDQIKTDLQGKLDYDYVMEFEYLQMCFNESLRLEPAANATTLQIFTEDTTLQLNGKPLTIKKGTPFTLLIECMH